MRTYSQQRPSTSTYLYSITKREGKIFIEIAQRTCLRIMCWPLYT